MSDWKSVKLGDVAKITMGQSPSSSTYNEFGYGLPFLQGCADFGPKYPIKKVYCSDPLKIAESNSILISVRAPVGALNIADTKYCIGRGLAGILGTSVDQAFLNYLISANIYKLESQSQGSTFAAINSGDLSNLSLEIPETNETQRTIANILSTVDDVIEKTEAAIDKYQAIKAGMMQDLFTRGIDTQTGKLRPTIEEAPELYKESELGWIPKEWDVTDFDDVIKEYFDFRGKTPLKLGMNWGGGSIKAISANNIEPGFINFNKEHYLASEDLYRAWMNHGDCSKGDVVMTSEAPLGVVAQIPDNNKYILSQRVFLFKVKPSSITNDYLYYLMNTDRFQNDLQRQSSGSTVTGIQQARLARIRMQLTRSLEEQLHISKILKSIDLGISDNKEMLSKYKNLKHGLMADLLTGKVRVNLNDNKVEKG